MVMAKKAKQEKGKKKAMAKKVKQASKRPTG